MLICKFIKKPEVFEKVENNQGDAMPAVKELRHS